MTNFTNNYQGFCELVNQVCQTPEHYAVRLQSVTTNTGYHMKLEYAQNFTTTTAKRDNLEEPWLRLAKVTAINGAVDYCSPGANSCTSLTQSWPVATITKTGPTRTDYTDVWADALANATTATVVSNLTSIQSPADPSVDFSMTYASGRVATYTRGGGTWNYSYVDSGGQRTTTVTQPLGGSKIYVSDVALRKLLSMTDELGRTTSYQYDSFVRPTRVTAPEGNYTEVTYDARGNITESRAVAKAASGQADIVTAASYPASCSNAKTCNQPASTTDARGNVTDYTYDANHGGVLSATAPAPTTGAVRPQVRYGYTALYAYYKNSAGTIVAAGSTVTKRTSSSACQTQATCTGTTDEAKTTTAYGATGVANNLLPTTVSAGNGTGTLTATTTSAWDMFGNLTSIDGPLAGTADTSGFRYDADRKLLMRVSPDPDGAGTLKHRAQRLTYNADGNVTKIEAGTTTTLTGSFTPVTSAERVEIAYDSLGRKAKQSLMSGTSTTQAVTQFSYDSKGRLSCTAQRMNTATFGSLPASACALGATGSAGPDRITQSIYNNADQLTENRVAVGTADAATERTLTYTPNAMLATLTDAEDNKTTFEYDGFDRAKKTRYPLPTQGSNASSTTDYEELTYDAASNVTARRLRDGQSIGLTYDNLNRVTTKNLPGAEPDVSYGYDLLSRMISASQTGHALSFTYDALSRNLTETGPLGTVSSQWDLAGRRTRLTYPGTGLYVDYDYLVTGETTKIRENGATSGVGMLATYAWDDLGRRTSLTFGNGVVQNYTFDPVSRLASLTNNLSGTTNDLSATFAYNPASQIASTTRTGDAYAWTGHSNQNVTGTPNGLNQLTSYGAKSLTHDARGNVTSFGTKSFTYSSENMLLTAPNSTTLSYDPLLRLAQEASGVATKFAYDGIDRIAEYNASNTLQRRYVHGPGVDEPLVWYEGTGTTNRRFLSSDERGSIVSVTDSAGGLLGINRYDEYAQPAATNLGVWGYTGQAWLSGPGLWYYKARVNEPELGRFLQTDPTGYDDGPNLYAYVGNDPVNLGDPTGLAAGSCVIAPGTRICGQYLTRDPSASAGTNGNPPSGPGGSTGGSGGGGGDDSGGDGGTAGVAPPCPPCLPPTHPDAPQSVEDWGGYWRGNVWVQARYLPGSIQFAQITVPKRPYGLLEWFYSQHKKGAEQWKQKGEEVVERCSAGNVNVGEVAKSGVEGAAKSAGRSVLTGRPPTPGGVGAGAAAGVVRSIIVQKCAPS